MVKKLYRHIMEDSLYRNSVFLMGSTLVTAVFGFAFWVLNARLFPPEQIGIATTLISATGLIMQFSLLGLKNGIIRYLPQSLHKSNVLNTAINLNILFSIFLSLLYLLFVPFLSSQLVFMRGNLLYIVAFIIGGFSLSLNQILEGTFVAYRSTGNVFVQNAVLGALKVVMPFFLISLGAFGIYFAFAYSTFLAAMYGIYRLMARYDYEYAPRINGAVIKEIGKFSSKDYLGIFFAYLPQLFIPLLIINHLGPKDSAFYYIDFQIANLLYIISVATTQSLFAEGTHSESDLKKHLKKAFGMILILTIPSIIVTYFLGGFVLQIFGHQYAENGIAFLRVLAITGIFVAIMNIGSAVVHIKRKVEYYMYLNCLSSIIYVVLSYLLISQKLLGLGYAWLISDVIPAIIYLFIMRKLLR